MLEWRKQVMQVLRLGLRPGLFLQGQDRAFAVGEGCLPFTIFAVERQNAVAGLEAQDVAEIMRLRFLEGEFREGDAVRVEAADGELVFSKTTAVPAAA